MDVGGDTSKEEHTYGIEWDSTQVNFYIDNRLARTVTLIRPLKPLRLNISLWTTTGGWDGLKLWAGETNWGTRANQPATASFQVISLPR